MAEYVEALEFLEESGADLANGYDNDGAIKLVEELQELGCKVFAELDDDEFYAVLFVHLPEKITSDVVVAIAHFHPDEVSEEEPNVLRLWWD